MATRVARMRMKIRYRMTSRMIGEDEEKLHNDQQEDQEEVTSRMAK